MPPVPAATLMILDAHVAVPSFLMVRRHPDVPVLGNSWVFPGGRVAESDRRQGGPDKAFVACAVRETKEEAGIEIDPLQLTPLLQWETPETIPHRFDTRFFAVVLETRPAVRVDGHEIVEHHWFTAQAALRRHQQQEVRLSPPAFVLLSWALSLQTAKNFLGYFRKKPFQQIKPRNISLSDGSCNLFESDAGYASGDLAADGPRDRLWMRASGWRYETFPRSGAPVPQQDFE